METDKAIERLKLHKDWGFAEETMIAIDAGIAALEKQIPKAVDTTIGGRLYGGCPVCGCLWQEPDHIHDYCDCCGQKLKMPWQNN